MKKLSIVAAVIEASLAVAVAGLAALAGIGDASANPVGASVVNGQVSISQQGNIFSITNTPNAIINWASFSIAPGEVTRFIQESGSSSVLNRITGQDPSRILGALQSNGKVFLINPNGILFGAGAQVNVGGLVASSLAMTNADFLAGRNNFTAGNTAGDVTNLGAIATPSGGKVVLIAPDVTNSGVITSPQGEVLLAAGHSVQLADTVNPSLHVVVSAPTDQAINLGQVLAQSGRIGIYGALVNQRGTLNADSAAIGENGKIVLRSSRTTLLEAGSATTATGAGSGGEIQLLGPQVGLMDNARVDASGQNGGGTVLAGGDTQGRNAAVMNAQQVYVGPNATISADALVRGDGGKVIVWGEQTAQAYGTISVRGGAVSGDGGFVETSGHVLDSSGLRVDAAAPSGKNGKWLLDPTDIMVSMGNDELPLSYVAAFANDGHGGTGSGTSVINASQISNSSANVILQATRDITFSQPVDIAANGVGLTAQAGRDINVGASITTHGGALVLSANDSGGPASGGGLVNISNGALLTTNGGLLTVTGYISPALSSCIASPSTAGCSSILPTLSTCIAAPVYAGCSAVLPVLSACIAAPATAGCSAVLPALSTCTAAPATAGCSVVLPTLAACIGASDLPGCRAVLPTLAACTAAPTIAGCSVVLPTLADCTATPALAGCSAVLAPPDPCIANPSLCAPPPPPLPTVAACTANPALADCASVLPTLGACTANPSSAGCSVVLPTLASCTANPAANGCSVVLPGIAACTVNPAAAGCSAVLPTLALCTGTPTAAGCSAVLPTLAACTATPTAPGCSAVLPTLPVCSINPGAPGCSAVLPSLALCTLNAALPGCAAVLPSLASCTISPAAAGCPAVLPSIAACTVAPAAAGCSAVLPPLPICIAYPATAGCGVVLPTLSACIADAAAAGCAVVLPTLLQCVSTPTLAGCSSVVPTVAACTANATFAGCQIVLPTAQSSSNSVLSQALNTVTTLVNTVPGSSAAGSAPGSTAGGVSTANGSTASTSTGTIASSASGVKTNDSFKKMYCN